MTIIDVLTENSMVTASFRLKRVAVVTASRADWGIYLPVLGAMIRSRAFDLDIVTSGRRDYIDKGINTNPLLDEQYDMVLVLGDTMPMLKAAIWGTEQNIPVCHIHGGDRTGSIDDKIRPAISAFADWHFPSLPEHAERLNRMGISAERINVVGPLGIYAMMDAEFIPEQQLRQELGLSDKPIILVIQHPVSTEVEQSGEQMRETLEAVTRFLEYQIVVIAPNGEPGSLEMMKIIASCEDVCQRLAFFDNLPYLTFLSLLKISEVIVGNSSCGLVEAPFFGVPCVNVGTRQGARERVSGLVVDVGYDRQAVFESTIDSITAYRVPFFNLYALGIDGPKIVVETLKTL